MGADTAREVGAERGAASYGAAVYVAVVQLLFFTTWTVYVVFLPQLVESVGLPKQAGLWLVLLDQALFALMDVAMGFAADRVEAWLGRIGGWIVGVTVVSCGAFVMLPWLVGEGALMRGLLVGAVVVWSITSSALRAPPLVLLSKHAAKPQLPWLAALALTGVAVGGAASPYLGNVMRDMDPRLPFAVSSAVLLATTAGLVVVERLGRARRDAQRRAEGGEAARRAPVQAPPVPYRGVQVAALVVGGLLVGLGFQGHFFVNSAAQFLRFLEASDLQYAMPVFWVGFNLALYPGAALARRIPAAAVLGIAAVVGGLGAMAAGLAPSLGVLLVAQGVAGAGWGAAFMAGISAALGLGRGGREGLVLGLWFTALSSAAVLRVALALAGVTKGALFASMSGVLAGMVWVCGALPLVFLGLYLVMEERR